MVQVRTLLKISALYVLNMSPLRGAHGQLIVVLPEDPSCQSTPDMVHNGLMAVTDPKCILADDDPGCNLFGPRDCRVCALVPKAIADDVPSCELLDIFKEGEALGAEPVGSEDRDNEARLPPPLIPSKPVNPIDPVEPIDSSVDGDYVPIVIVLPTDVFIDPESSVWTDSEGSSGFGEDSDAGDKQISATVTPRRLRTRL